MGTSNLPIFIVGTGRSGTNLLWEMMNLHPRVFIVNETHWISVLQDAYGASPIPSETLVHAIENTCLDFTSSSTLEYSFESHPNLPRSSFTDFWSQLRKRILSRRSFELRDFLPFYFDFLAKWANADVVGDKTPDYGLRMQDIQSLLPSARFVHVRRAGKAVAKSMMRMGGFRYLAFHGLTEISPYLFEDRLRERTSPYGHSPGAVLFKLKSRLGVHRWAIDKLPSFSSFYQVWRRREDIILRQSRLLAEGSYLEVTCEDLCQKPKETLETVCNFLNLPITPEWERRAVSIIRPR
jgi:hypothetical protein